MSEAHRFYAEERNESPVGLSGDARHLTHNANNQISQNVNTVTVVRSVQSRPINTANSLKRADARSPIELDRGKTYSKSPQNFASREIGDKGFVVVGSTFPTRIETGRQASQVSGGLVESCTEYITLGNSFSNQRPNQAQAGIQREHRVNGGRISHPRNAYSCSEGETLSVIRTTNWRAVEDARGLSSETLTGGSLRSPRVDLRDTTIVEGQEPLTVQSVHVHGSPTNLTTHTEYNKLTDSDIRLISASSEHGLRPVTVHNPRLESTPAELKTQTDVDHTYTIGKQDIRIIPSKTERKCPIIVHNLRLDGTPAEWKRLTVKPIEEQEDGSGSTHTLPVDLQQSHSVDQRLSNQTREEHETLVYSTSAYQEPTERHTSSVQQLRQVFRRQDSFQQDKGSTRTENKIARADTNTCEPTGYIVRTTSTPVESSFKRQHPIVYQVQVTPGSLDRTFREVEVEKRRERRAARRSDSNSSSGCAESSNMGNDTQKMAQADVTVEEDAGGNKMIVVEGRNIRVHSENYDTGKKGAKRVVLMPESARSGNKQFQVNSEGSVNSYNSYDKRGQKEKMVVINGRLRESTYTGPNTTVKVAKISTPTTERKEVSETPQPQSSQESTPQGRVTRVNVVKRQVSSSTSDGQSFDETRPRDIRQSLLLFEKPQQTQHQRMHMGEKGIANIRRLTHQNHPAPDMVKEVTIRPQQTVMVQAEPTREERKIIRVANSAHLARSLRGDEVILEKSPPPKRIVREHVTGVREGAPPQIVREQSVQEIRHNAQLPPRPRPPAQLRRDDNNVFNSQYYVRRENPLFAEQNGNSREIHHHGQVVVKQADTNVNRDNRNHLGHVVVKQAQINGKPDNHHRGHVIVKQATKQVAEEPHYATVNKVRNQGHPAKTAVHVTPVSPIIHDGRPKQLHVEDHHKKASGSESKEYGLSALARQGEARVEKKIVHDEVEGEISETNIVKTESAPVAPERRAKKEYKVPVLQDVPLPRKEKLAHVIVEETITPSQGKQVEGGINWSLLESESTKRQNPKVTKHADRDHNVQRSDVLLGNAQLPDQFFYAYEGNKLRKQSMTASGHGEDTVDGEEQITATVSSNVNSERQILEEMAATRQQRIKPKSNSVRQNVHVDHEESDIKGEPHLCHADGSDANSLDLLTFDTVSEDVNLGVKDGVAQVEVKVRCERVSPIEGSACMWQKSAVIITRLVQVDLEANEERRELYRKILANEIGGKPMIDNKAANQRAFRNGEIILDKKQTFHVYSALMGIADDDEREALSERRPSKLLSIDSGEPEDRVDDVHRYVKARKSMKRERSHKKHHHHSSRRGDASRPSHNSVDLLY